ncbi:MAG: tetratricopeptide repeat protein [Proteobacteria bacterium]|nr:tetratricopeptide repeat protein [Pseudomonadota bacterium]
MLVLILTYLPSLLCGIHAVRSGQQMYWLWILVIAPVLGPLIYVFAVIVPEFAGGRTARGAARAARQALDPERDYRAAKQALDETPTIGNRMRFAQAAEGLGRWQEAEAQWAQSVDGPWAEDPAVLMGHARTLIELGRYDEALKRLEQLRALGREGETPQAQLALARAYEGLGRNTEADAAYRACVDRVPGLEAGGRYVAYLARVGRKADAEVGLAELDRRLQKIAPPLRPEARQWRDLAAGALARM